MAVKNKVDMVWYDLGMYLEDTDILCDGCQQKFEQALREEIARQYPGARHIEECERSNIASREAAGGFYGGNNVEFNDWPDDFEAPEECPECEKIKKED